MTDLVTWLRAQLDREEGDANLIPGGGYQPAKWTAHRVTDGDWSEIRQHDLPVGAPPGEWEETSTAGLMVWGRNEDQHVARWDPARVVAEVAAKRAILDEIFQYEAVRDGEWGCCHGAGEIAAGNCPEIPVNEIRAVQLLALPYAMNPGYDESWRPE